MTSLRYFSLIVIGHAQWSAPTRCKTFKILPRWKKPADWIIAIEHALETWAYSGFGLFVLKSEYDTVLRKFGDLRWVWARCESETWAWNLSMEYWVRFYNLGPRSAVWPKEESMTASYTYSRRNYTESRNVRRRKDIQRTTRVILALSNMNFFKRLEALNTTTWVDWDVY